MRKEQDMRADAGAKSLNYKEMVSDLNNREYDTYQEFLEEVRAMVRNGNLTIRHHGLLVAKAKEYFGIED